MQTANDFRRIAEAGAWGRQGCTRVLLAHVDAETLGEALTTARRNVDRPVAKPRAHQARAATTKRRT